MFAGDPAEAASVPLPLLPWLEEDPGSWTVQDSFRDLPYDALTLLENVLDVSHVPFTHHATVGKRESAGPVALELTSSGPQGFTGVWPEGPRKGSLGSQSTVFTGPCLMVHDLQGKGPLRFQTVVYATPIRRGHCRLLVRLPFRFGSPWPGRLINLRPEWLQHLGNHVVLEDDQLFLHAQERVLEERGGGEELVRSCHLATRADTYVRALHDWVSVVGGGPFGEAPCRIASARRPCWSATRATRATAAVAEALTAAWLSCVRPWRSSGCWPWWRPPGWGPAPSPPPLWPWPFWPA